MKTAKQKSEFEGQGLKKFGGFGIQDAWEKLRYIMRTEKDPDVGELDLNADADRFEEGGVHTVPPDHIMPKGGV